MGFEILFEHYTRQDDGTYNKDEVQTMKRKVGDPYEEVPLEKLAGFIMAQLARRDVWVTGVKITEFVRKEISFRESKNSIIIKNKKFSLDHDTNIIVQDMVEEQKQPELLPHNLINQTKLHKMVLFQPELPQLPKVKHLNLTVDKKYLVLEQKLSPNGVTLIYKILDNENREIDISDVYFAPMVSGIETEEKSIEKKINDKLWRDSGVVTDNVPNLR